MKLRNAPPHLEWVRQKLQTLVYKLDNSGDTDIERNGERAFIVSVCQHYFNTDTLVVFDIGANAGDYSSLLLHERGPRPSLIHAFEPQRSCFNKLTQLFEANPSISLNHFGLSDKSEGALIYKNTDGSGLASLYQRNLAHYNIAMDQAETIALKRGDDYCTDHAIEHIHLMKVDVEGHELSVFEGFGDFFSAHNIDLIQFEYGGANLDSKTSLLELFSFFEDKGFVLTKMMRSGLEKRHYHPRLENFVYQNWVAVSPYAFNV